MVAPVFIDAAGAAEILRMPIDSVLDLISEGRLRTFGGKAANPFVRSADVSVLAAELGAATGPTADEPKRVKSPSARVQVRLTADARWADVSEGDIHDWVHRADPARRQAARKAAHTGIERLRAVLQALDDEDSD